VCGILIGYIAGALNNKSMRIKRMLGASLTACITIGVFQFILDITVAFSAWMTLQGNVWFTLFTTMLPMVILGILVPIVARISAGSELWHF
jgi:magnesium-transporting ATPase (P-type)